MDEVFSAVLPVLAESPQLSTQLELFVMPKLPERPRYRCMRLGGPVSPTNPDPLCDR